MSQRRQLQLSLSVSSPRRSPHRPLPEIHGPDGVWLEAHGRGVWSGWKVDGFGLVRFGWFLLWSVDSVLIIISLFRIRDWFKYSNKLSGSSSNELPAGLACGFLPHKIVADPG